MSEPNSWAEFAGIFLRTREAYAEHERAKTELKALVPEDAREASGHGIRARRSKAGAISFDVQQSEAAFAPVNRSRRSGRTRQGTVQACEPR
jgi:hypothetical protein